MEKTDNLIDLLNKSENLNKENEIKVVVMLKAVGSAPILSSNKIKISGSVKVANLYEYLKKNLKKNLNDNDSLFLYCNSNFAPSPNTLVIDLFNNYSVNNELHIFYALSEAWG